MSKQPTIVVTGAGGFIGGHLVADFRRQGIRNIRAIDIKPLDEWYQVFPDVENHAGPVDGDARDFRLCRRFCKGATDVYQLAADMGGMGFIENNKALCMLSVLTNTHMLLASQEAGADRFFFSSSACVYNAEKQLDPNVTALAEADANAGNSPLLVLISERAELLVATTSHVRPLSAETNARALSRISNHR